MQSQRETSGAPYLGGGEPEHVMEMVLNADA